MITWIFSIYCQKLLTFWGVCGKILISFGRAAFAETQDKDPGPKPAFGGPDKG